MYLFACLFIYLFILLVVEQLILIGRCRQKGQHESMNSTMTIAQNIYIKFRLPKYIHVEIYGIGDLFQQAYVVFLRTIQQVVLQFHQLNVIFKGDLRLSHVVQKTSECKWLSGSQKIFTESPIVVVEVGAAGFECCLVVVNVERAVGFLHLLQEVANIKVHKDGVGHELHVLEHHGINRQKRIIYVMLTRIQQNKQVETDVRGRVLKARIAV